MVAGNPAPVCRGSGLLSDSEATSRASATVDDATAVPVVCRLNPRMITFGISQHPLWPVS